MKLSRNEIKKYRLFIGPMSKNVVDAAIEISKTGKYLGLIPSRRQVEFNRGYVNNWSTKDFVDHVRGQGASDLILQRDHGGPMQGSVDDDGKSSFLDDCNSGINILHIDPFKDPGVSSFEYAAKISCDLIRLCLDKNPNMLFEIGTEEAIFPYDHVYLDNFLSKCKRNLGDQVFQDSVIFGVVQCGTALKGDTNTGSFDSDRLERMIQVCKSHNLLSKEHNGDYLDEEEFKKRFRIGLDAINIAPEFGTDETKILLSMMEKVPASSKKEDFYNLCYESRKWEKWIGSNFIPDTSDKKRDLMVCSGHYVFGDNKFGKIKEEFSEIDEIAFQSHYRKLSRLLGLIDEEIS